MERSNKKDMPNRALERKENELFDPAGVSGLCSFRYRGGFFNEKPMVAPNNRIGKRSLLTVFPIPNGWNPYLEKMRLIIDRVYPVVEENGLSIDNPEQVEPARSAGLVEIGIKILGCPEPPALLVPSPDSVLAVVNHVEPTVDLVVDPAVAMIEIKAEPMTLPPATG